MRQKRVHLRGLRDEVRDGVDDDGGQAGRRDPEEGGRKPVQRNYDDKPRKDASEGRADTTFRLESRTREGSRRGVGVED